MKPSRSEFLTIRGLRYHIRHWGCDDAPKVFMLHGWMDVSASFQFVVDALRREWHVIAPDWRGFGLSDSNGTDTYWFADYIGDLDMIVNYYAAGEQINLLGHSMGGNAVCLYAGIRPSRIRRLINLEGFGLPAMCPEQAPARYAKWLDELRAKPDMSTYGSLQEVAVRLKKNNPRLTDERAAFLAAEWARPNAVGNWEILGDPVHKLTSPILYRIEEVLACWQAITAPVLWVEGEDTEAWRWMGPKDPDAAREEVNRRIRFIRNVSRATVSNASHMLHHDQPELVAEMIEHFLV